MISPETKLTPKQFCDATHACENGVEYALTQPDMAAVWDNCPRVDWLLWIADKVGCMPDDKTLRLFAVWCVRETPLGDGRKVFDLLTDDRSKNSLLISEKYANGNATQRELAAARTAAWFSAWDAALAAAQAAAWFSALAAARDAARDAALAAARAAAWSSAYTHQANHLRTLIKNPFKETNK